MKQRKEDRLFLDIAERISKESKCVSHKVGSILVQDGRIISIGYNGTPAGFTNCDEMNFSGYGKNTRFGSGLTEKERAIHHNFSEKYEIHSELNTILFAAKHGISITGSTLYTTIQPCYNCTKMICNSGISRVVYEKDYDKVNYDVNILKMIKISGITFEKFI